jgi:tetratricopeptide (TPR) repeat protein
MKPLGISIRTGLATTLGAVVAAALAGCGGGERTPGPDRESAYRANNLGVALLEQFQYGQAASVFREALAIDPALAIARVNLSLALLYVPDLEGAAREATEALKLLPSAPQPPYVLGLIARAENRPDDAMKWFEQVRGIDPGDIGAGVNLGQIYLENRRFAEAIAILRPAAAAEPYHVTAAYVLGLALSRSGEAAEGQRLLESAQALRTTGYAVTFGTQYLEQGRYAEAISSTGAEPDLVDPAVPTASFAPATIGTPPSTAAATASPFGRRFRAADLTEAGARELAASLGGGLVPIDADADGDLDLFVASAEGQQLLRNGGDGSWTDATAGSGLEAIPPDAVPVGCVVADYDNDGADDLYVLRYGQSSLYRNDGSGRFTDVSRAAGLAAYPFLPGAAAFVDLDHDGDVDLAIAGLADIAASRRRATGEGLLFPREFEGAPLQILRNNRDGTFTDITRESRVEGITHAVALAPTDFDNRRDIDLLVVGYDGAPRLFKNLRDGTFSDVAADVGLGGVGAPGGEVASVTVGDVNQDDYPDFFFSAGSGGVFAMSDGRGRLTLAPGPDGARAATAAQFVDYDSDGLLDLLVWRPDGPRVFRNLGAQWSDVTSSALPAAAVPPAPASAHGLATADLDRDGRPDLVTARGRQIVTWRNSGDSRRRTLRVSLQGLASNRMGVGAKVQLRAGSLKGRFERSAATPAVAPADLVFGLGGREGADVVRVLWPSGILQAEAVVAGGPEAPTPGPPASGASTRAGFLPSPLAIRELDRKPSSCPYLFTWNGERFEFVTDFLGGGEMGYLHSPGVFNVPDPVEYVRIRADQLKPRDDRFEIRVTNELEEALFVDRLQLLAVAHPTGIDVFPNEGMTDPPKPFKLHGVRHARVPARATDGQGRDVTDRIARLDRRYPDDFALASIRGYAAAHALTLDLGTVSGPAVLLLTGWTDYAFSSDNVAAHQAGLVLVPPSLEVRDVRGAWRKAAVDVGIPVGRPQTIAVDLSGHLRPGEHELRLSTSMRIYWDQILVGSAFSTDGIESDRIDPASATLRSRGFSAPVRPGGRGHESYDYDLVSPESPWKVMAGRYTREGDVRELLLAVDDMFVVSKPGDEVAVGFDAAALGPLPDGWTRTFLLLAVGYSKEMDINSASPDTVEPLPFRRMSRYPYVAPEQYPDTPEHRRYLETYNTRTVVKPVPSIQVPR